MSSKSKSKKKEEKVKEMEPDSSLFFIDKSPSTSSIVGNKRANQEINTTAIKRMKHKTEEKDQEELELERELFGGKEFIQNFGNDKSFLTTSFLSSEEEEKGQDEKEKNKIESVWNDEDEEGEKIEVGKGKIVKVSHGTLKNEKEIVSIKQYEENLRSEFKKKSLLRDDWATKPYKESEEDERSEEEDNDEIQRTTISRLGKTGLLESGKLNVKQIYNANRSKIRGKLPSVRFHPKNPLLSVASDTELLLYQIDRKKNPLVSHLELPEMRFYSAEYGANGQEIILCGNRPSIYSFDLSNSTISVYSDRALSQFGKGWNRIVVSPDNQYLALETKRSPHVPLLSNLTKRMITKFTMKCSVTNSQFSPDGNYLTCASEFGEIFRWDLRMRRCVDKSDDNGQLTRALAYSKDGSYLATGAENGIVQVYSNSEIVKKLSSPIKQMDHLVTGVSEMKFNHDSQILATRSELDSTGTNGFKLYHVPTFHSFSNFPMPKTFGGKITSFDFSANGGFLAVASSGDVSLFRLFDYTNV